jgi:hypothetical protein
MLAGDPDEALESAEVLLKDRSLTSYYDEVALGGLQLAANDASRGVLAGPQLERVKDSVKALVNDLSGHDDIEPEKDETEDEPVAPPESEKPVNREPAINEKPPPSELVPEAWKADGAVLCVAGRGPLDEAAATMLAQLLRKHGLGTRVVPHEAVSRSAVLSLDTAGVRMVCISYLEISGTPAHVRYLLRRLRRRIAGVPVLVGLWPADDAIMRDEELRSIVGADYYVASLRDAVVCCLKAATEEAGKRERDAAQPARKESPPSERAPLPA